MRDDNFDMDDGELDQQLRQDMLSSESRRKSKYYSLSLAYGEEKKAGGLKLRRTLGYRRVGKEWFISLLIDGLEVGHFGFRRAWKYFGDIIPDTVSAKVHTYVLSPEEFYQEVFSFDRVKDRYRARFERDIGQLEQVVDRLGQIGPHEFSTLQTVIMCQIRKGKYSE